MAPPTRTTAKCKAFVDPSRMYNQGMLCEMGIGHELMMQARRAGVKPHRIGIMNWYRGDELIEWMKSHPRTER